MVDAENVVKMASSNPQLNLKWAPDMTALICFTSGELAHKSKCKVVKHLVSSQHSQWIAYVFFIFQVYYVREEMSVFKFDSPSSEKQDHEASLCVFIWNLKCCVSHMELLPIVRWYDNYFWILNLL